MRVGLTRVDICMYLRVQSVSGGTSCFVESNIELAAIAAL